MLSVEPGLRCRLPCFPFHSLKRHLRSYIGIEGQLSCTSHTSGHAPHPFSGVSSVGKPVPHVLCSQTTCPWGLFPRESCESKLLALGGPLLSRSPYLIHPPLLVLAYLRMSFSLVQTTAFPVPVCICECVSLTRTTNRNLNPLNFLFSGGISLWWYDNLNVSHFKN